MTSVPSRPSSYSRRMTGRKICELDLICFDVRWVFSSSLRAPCKGRPTLVAHICVFGYYCHLDLIIHYCADSGTAAAGCHMADARLFKLGLLLKIL